MGGLLGGSKAPAPAPPIQRDDARVQAAKKQERQKLAALAQKDTILTGGAGVTDPAITRRKKLTGE